MRKIICQIVWSYLERAGHFEIEEQRHEQQAGQDARNAVPYGPHKQLCAVGVHLGRGAQHQYPTDERDEDGQRYRDRLHAPIGHEKLLRRPLSTARQGMVEPDGQGDPQYPHEYRVVRHVKALVQTGPHGRGLTPLWAGSFAPAKQSAKSYATLLQC